VSYLDGRAGAGGALVSEQELTGFRARIFLHELDHLDGVLFTDRLLDPKHLMTDEALEKRARL
jgi:peptide deformylase